MVKRFAMIAGAGPLPRALIDILPPDQCFLISLEEPGMDPSIVACADVRASVLAPTGILEALKASGAEQVLWAGMVHRPSLGQVSGEEADPRAKELLASGGGDDALMRRVAQVIEQETGMRIVGPDQVLGNQSFPAGAVGRVSPSALDLADIARGVTILNHLAVLDFGQAVVVQGQAVLAVEAAEGTNSLIERAGHLRRSGDDPKGSLIKLCKHQQDRRFDLPTLGAQTVACVKDAGLGGIAFDATAMLILNPDEVVRAADQLGLFLYSVARET